MSSSTEETPSPVPATQSPPDASDGSPSETIAEDQRLAARDQHDAKASEQNETGCLGSVWTMVSGAIGCGCAVILIIVGIIALILGLLAT